jgi:hypothetical protein
MVLLFIHYACDHCDRKTPVTAQMPVGANGRVGWIDGCIGYMRVSSTLPNTHRYLFPSEVDADKFGVWASGGIAICTPAHDIVRVGTGAKIDFKFDSRIGVVKSIRLHRLVTEMPKNGVYVIDRQPLAWPI